VAYVYYAGGALDVAYILGAVAAVYMVSIAALNFTIDGILVAALYKYSIDGRMPEAYTKQGVVGENVAW
jgi:hypothetical protein